MIRIQWKVDETQRDATDGGDTLETTFGELTLDATISETTDITAEATEHPVEEGVNVTDHVRPGLLRIQLDCIVTNTPIRPMVEGASIETRALSLPSGSKSVSARVLTFAQPFDRPVEVVDQLRELIHGGTRVDILDLRLGDLEGWLLIGMSPEVNALDSVRFTLTAQELRTAVTEEVESPSPRVERARRSADNGRQNGADENATQQNGVDASLLRRASDVREGLGNILLPGQS